MVEKRMYLVSIRWLGTGREGHMIVLAESRDDAKAMIREVEARYENNFRANYLTVGRMGQVVVI